MIRTLRSLYISPSIPLHHYSRKAIVDARTGVLPARPFQEFRKRHALKQQNPTIRANSNLSSKSDVDAAKRL